MTDDKKSLEELLEERRALDRRIKEAQNAEFITIGRVRCDRFQYTTGKETYRIKVAKHSDTIKSERNKYYTIIETYSKEDALDLIRTVAKDLMLMLGYLKDLNKE